MFSHFTSTESPGTAKDRTTEKTDTGDSFLYRFCDALYTDKLQITMRDKSASTVSAHKSNFFLAKCLA